MRAAAHPELEFGERSKMVAEMWASLTDEAQKPNKVCWPQHTLCSRAYQLPHAQQTNRHMRTKLLAQVMAAADVLRAAKQRADAGLPSVAEANAAKEKARQQEQGAQTAYLLFRGEKFLQLAGALAPSTSPYTTCPASYKLMPKASTLTLTWRFTATCTWCVHAAAHPELMLPELSRVVGFLWTAMSAAERRPYQVCWPRSSAPAVLSHAPSATRAMSACAGEMGHKVGEFSQRIPCKFDGCCSQKRGRTHFCSLHGGGIRCAACKKVGVGREGRLCWGCRMGTPRALQLQADVGDLLIKHDMHVSLIDKVVPNGKVCFLHACGWPPASSLSLNSGVRAHACRCQCMHGIARSRWCCARSRAASSGRTTPSSWTTSLLSY